MPPRLLDATAHAACAALSLQACKNLLIGANDTPVPFQHGKVQQWTSTLVENILKDLSIANSDQVKKEPKGQCFKFVVTAHMQQKVGAAMVTASAMFGDKQVDAFTSVKYETDSVQVLVVVYGIAI